MRVRVELGPRDAKAGTCVLAISSGTAGTLAAKRTLPCGEPAVAAVQHALGRGVDAVAGPSSPQPMHDAAAIIPAADTSRGKVKRKAGKSADKEGKEADETGAGPADKDHRGSVQHIETVQLDQPTQMPGDAEPATAQVCKHKELQETLNWEVAGLMNISVRAQVASESLKLVANALMACRAACSGLIALRTTACA